MKGESCDSLPGAVNPAQLTDYRTDFPIRCSGFRVENPMNGRWKAQIESQPPFNKFDQGGAACVQCESEVRGGEHRQLYLNVCLVSPEEGKRKTKEQEEEEGVRRVKKRYMRVWRERGGDTGK